jgi:hypothetical protein
MQPLAFLWFELEVAQQSLRESFVESQVPAEAGMASGELRAYFLIQGALVKIVALSLC